MTNLARVATSLKWIMTLLLVSFLSACGGDPAPSADKALTAYSLAGVPAIINETGKTISVTLPTGTVVTSLTATFTTTGASVNIGSAPQTSGVTSHDFTHPVAYVVVAADASTATYTATVTVAPANSKAITSYSLGGVAGTINESTRSVSVVLPFGTSVVALPATFVTTGASVKVGSVTQASGVTTNNFSSPVAYTVTAADSTQASYLVTVTLAQSTAKALLSFSLAGVVGTINESGKTVAVTMPFGTNVTALVATFTTSGSSVKVASAAQVSGTTANDFTSAQTYTVTAADGSTAAYAVTVGTALSAAKAITAFSLNSVLGGVTEGAKTISVTMPFGTNVTALVATFSATGVGVKIGATAQTSGTTANSFASPVTYTVSAADGSTAAYVVTVTVAANSAKAVTAYTLGGVTGTINEGAKTIAVTLPFGTSVTSQIATFTITGASLKVGATAQASGVTANNFTNPVVYTVTAGDASTATYTATVTVASGTAGVPLATAANYTIFANTGIDTVPGPSAITGSIGVGPGVTSTAITGFVLNLPAASPFATSPQVTVKVYAFDFADPTPAEVTLATGDMGTAFTNASSRSPTSAATTNVGAGTLTNLTLTPGVYEWGSAVIIPTDLTLSGNATDVWIFKVAGTLDMAAAKNVILVGSPKAKNIFWQVDGAVSIGAGTHFEGIILGKSSITFGSNASINGRLLAQTAVNLNAVTVVQPAP